MSSNPLAAATLSGNLYDETVGGTLRSLVDRYGVTLLGESGRLRGLLQDECPQAKREISVLLQALDERVPQDLLRVHSGEPIASLSPRLAKRLADEKAMSPQASRWAVATWAQGLGLEAALGIHPDFVGNDDDAPPRPPVIPMAANEAFDLPQEPPPVPPSKLPKWLTAVAIAAVVIGCLIAFFWPKLQITGVDVEGPFVGDGKPHAVVVRFDVRNNTVRSIESRFVRGDGNWSNQASTYDVAGTSASIQANAGTLAYTTAKPINVTFSYVLIDKDGKRSAPFEHTFAIVPPLVITDVSVPRAVRVGQNFAVAIRYQRSGADVVKVERHVVSSSVPWPQNDVEQALGAPDASGVVQYNFDAAPKPFRSTIEFVLVDAQGVRSEPRRVALNVGTVEPSGTGPGVVLSIQELKTPGQPTGVGAVIGGLLGNTLGHGRGRTATTVVGAAGGAYAGQQVEGSARESSVWRITVRLDDGSTKTLSQSTAPHWRVGDRVVVENGAIH